MKLNHKFVVPAPFDVAWDAFNDIENMVPCVPGAALTSLEGDNFSGTVKVKLGPISMVYGGTGVFIERDKATGRMVVQAKGKDKRGNGTAGATVTAQITAEGTGTAVEVTTDLAVTGKPAQFGRGVIQDVSDKLLGQFVDCISAKLSPDRVEGAPAADTTGAASATESEPAGPTEPAEPAEPSGPAEPAESVSTSEPVRSVAPAEPPRSGAGSVSKPAELNLMSTVMPVLMRRFALPVVIIVAVAVVVVILVTR